MNHITERALAATASEIRSIIGPFEEDVVLRILSTGATAADVTEAYAWLRSDENLHRRLAHGLHGAAAQVFEILDKAFPDFDSGYRMD